MAGFLSSVVNSDYPDSKVHGANMGPIWGRQDPGGPHVGPMNFAIRELFWRMICIINQLRPKQNGRKFTNDIFRCIFLNENIWISIKISLRFVSKGPINIIPA